MIYILSILYIVVSAVAFGVFDQYYIGDLLHSLRGQLLIILIFLSGLIIIQRLILGVIAALLSITLSIFHIYPIATGNINQENSISVSVKQINLRYFNHDLDGHFKAFNNDNWDLLLLLEFSDKNRKAFASIKPGYKRFGYAEIEGFPMGIGVISKYPIIYREVIHVVGKKVGYVHLKLLIENQLIELIVAHPPSPRNEHLWQHRNKLLKVLNQVTSEFKQPWLLAGDLNTVPWSRYLNFHKGKICYDMEGHYSSWVAFEELPEWLSGIPIDHCVMSHQINLNHFSVSSFKGSDHLLLDYELSF